VDLVGAGLPIRQVARVVQLEPEKYPGARSVVSVVTRQEAANSTHLIAVVGLQALSVMLRHSWVYRLLGANLGNRLL
jgi:hypothetical protein